VRLRGSVAFLADGPTRSFGDSDRTDRGDWSKINQVPANHGTDSLSSFFLFFLFSKRKKRRSRRERVKSKKEL